MGTSCCNRQALRSQLLFQGWSRVFCALTTALPARGTGIPSESRRDGLPGDTAAAGSGDGYEWNSQQGGFVSMEGK